MRTLLPAGAGGELGLDHAVALARRRLQPGAVENGDVAAGVADQARLLEVMRGRGDALTAHPQHVGDELLGHQQLVRGPAVVGQQEPAAEALLDRVQAVAHGGLRDLGDQRLGVAQERELKRAAAPELFQ